MVLRGWSLEEEDEDGEEEGGREGEAERLEELPPRVTDMGSSKCVTRGGPRCCWSSSLSSSSSEASRWSHLL